MKLFCATLQLANQGNHANKVCVCVCVWAGGGGAGGIDKMGG